MGQPSHSPALLSWQVIKNHFHRMFLPSNSLDTVSPTDLLFCFEVLSPELAKERVVELQVQQVGGVTLRLLVRLSRRGRAAARVMSCSEHQCPPRLPCPAQVPFPAQWVLSPAASAGAQRPCGQVCSLPEEAALRG